MKKVIKIIMYITITILLGFGGWKAYDWVTGELEKEEQLLNEEKQLEEEAKGKIEEEDLEKFETKGLNPFGQQKAMNEMTDRYYQDYIHGMSHQKVRASEKWGFYEIHPDRIQWLLDGLEEVDLNHEDIYREILEKWAASDFSTIDDDHNAIWDLQGGTIGKATGILSPEEEEAYINKNK
ncbi:DUF6241 domain-containing protein [Ornithinibacillus halophilus]|uniref:Uncharacterized protein n=1 Tax=Ornithinibacillus halophilus TaxID=930117 RepID=A0A1M5HRX5_9BACI|nr:DUF6241 domain-containing protein [Ornithinibacillus halophilus]SHG18724.1 hypothetical protein SAMN05216225_101929 [Ornithinibacillus halophilus]